MLAVVCNGVRRLHQELVGQLNEVEDNCESTNVCGTKYQLYATSPQNIDAPLLFSIACYIVAIVHEKH